MSIFKEEEGVELVLESFDYLEALSENRIGAKDHIVWELEGFIFDFFEGIRIIGGYYSK